MSKLHLVCNAHLDPIWLWEWEEGAAEAISTFRTAAELCEEFDDFVFNHNEVVLYEWVEEYDPPLFERIQRLVKQGRWKIMGGWYLQPDCNMPSGESFVRQIRYGRDYFRDRFGAEPKVAINFDPFGHTRGLVQIMAKAGYHGYVFCRPGPETYALPNSNFSWIGFDGSRITAHRAWGHYLSKLGQATEKIDKWLAEHGKSDTGLLLWGVGDHGGGPSRVDLNAISEMIDGQENERIQHSWMEAFFDEPGSGALPEHADDINPWAVGCYTSQIRIKQKHRALENELYATEKMLSAAAMHGFLTYPEAELKHAERDLLFGEFHDILPGSSIQPAEDAALRTFDHGLEIVSRLKARAFFAIAAGEQPGSETNIPVFVYNPHPYPVSGVYECEFQLADQQRGDGWTVPTAYVNGTEVPCQLEKEHSNLNLDWRKRVAVDVDIPASSLLRVDCKVELQKRKPEVVAAFKHAAFEFDNGFMKVAVNGATGLIDSYIRDGDEYLRPGAFRLAVMRDSDDPWEMTETSINEEIGEFSILGSAAAAAFAGIYGPALEPIRVIEDGGARTVVEGLFGFGDSRAVVQYLLPKRGADIEIRITVYWNEKRKMLKLVIPSSIKSTDVFGQTAFGVQRLPEAFQETVAQKWCGTFSDQHGVTMINNGTYGLSCDGGVLKMSLLRSPGYSVHPIDDRPLIPEDRFLPRIDQGERRFSFWFCGGSRSERLASVDREAQVKNEKPFALSFNPGGQARGDVRTSGQRTGGQRNGMRSAQPARTGDPRTGDPRTGEKALQPVVNVSGDSIVMSSLAMRGGVFVMRLNESVGTPQDICVELPLLGISEDVSFGPFEVKTFEVDPETRMMKETRIDR